ncbi:hypothetical protein ES703_73506 [subsurface metagenome]
MLPIHLRDEIVCCHQGIDYQGGGRIPSSINSKYFSARLVKHNSRKKVSNPLVDTLVLHLSNLKLYIIVDIVTNPDSP